MRLELAWQTTKRAGQATKEEHKVANKDLECVRFQRKQLNRIVWFESVATLRDRASNYNWQDFTVVRVA